MALITLCSLQDTQTLGAAIGRQLGRLPVHIFLSGELGCGKTTLARAIVAALPGGDEAEVSSPSFTIANEYPTTPPILHCDLYRCAGQLPEEIDEQLDEAYPVIIMEWADNLAACRLPKNRLDIEFRLGNNARLLNMQPHGQNALQLLEALKLAPEA